MIYDTSKLTKEINFPVIRAIPSKSEPGFFNHLKKFFFYKRMFELQEDYVIWSEYLKEYVFVPNKSWTDGASVPRIFFTLYDPMGVLLLGATPHDEGYKYGGIPIVHKETGKILFIEYSKYKLDKMLQDFCCWESGLPIATGLATRMLMLGGWFTWWNYRRKDRKIYEDFPEIFK